MSAQEIDEGIRRETVSQCYTAYTRQGGNVYPESETEQALRAEIARLKAQVADAKEWARLWKGMARCMRGAWCESRELWAQEREAHFKQLDKTMEFGEQRDALTAKLVEARESRKRLVGLIHTARAANRKVAMAMVMRANALGIENCSLRARLAKLVDRWSHMVPMNKYSDEQVAYYDGLHDCADELDAALKGAK